MTSKRPARRGRIALALLALAVAGCNAPMADRVADTTNDPPPGNGADVATAAVTEATAPPAAHPATADPSTIPSTTPVGEPEAGDVAATATAPPPGTTTPVEVIYETDSNDTTVTATVTKAGATVTTAEIEPGVTHTFDGLEAGTYTITVEERSAVVEEPDVGLAWSFLARTDPIEVAGVAAGAEAVVVRCAANEGCTVGPITTP